MKRRLFIGSMTAGALAAGAAHAQSPQRARRVLFNWDGDDVMDFADAPMPLDDFVRYVFSPLENSTVDAVLWCPAGGNEAAYASKVLEPLGESAGYRFRSYSDWRRSASPRKLIEEGNDPLTVIVRECRKRRLAAFASLRMNDCHDAAAPKWTWVGFKQKHPEWLQPERKDWETALNFAVPEVRELKLAIVDEYFQNYDLDGVELDWLRHSVHLEKGWEYRMRYALTDFMREARRRTRARAAERGRPIEIAVRVPETLAGCLQSGYDLPVWIAEDLFDILIVGQGQSSPPPYDEFRALMKKRRLPIYPCVYGYGAGHPLYSDEILRGMAATMWRSGADGIYTFNWYPYAEFRRDVLKQIGDPAKLRGLDKHYLVETRYLADYSYYNRMESPLPVKLYTTSGAGPVIPIYVADDLSAGRVAVNLKILFSEIGPQDRVDVSFNGRPVSQGKWAPFVIPDAGGAPGFTGAQTWFEAQLHWADVRQGHNDVGVTLRERNPAIITSPQVRQVEIITRFS